MVGRAIVAAVLTAIVFISGLSFGLFWDSLRSRESEREINELVVYSSALFLESRLLEEAGCGSLKPILDEAVNDLSDSLEKYEYYVRQSRLDLDGENLLYRRYLMSNLRYWFFVTEFKEKCDVNNTVMLFFFDRDCAECDIMSERLTFLKNKYGAQVLVFPVNMDLANKDPVANTLKGIYNITSYPAVVISGETYGYLTKEELEGFVCNGDC